MRLILLIACGLIAGCAASPPDAPRYTEAAFRVPLPPLDSEVEYIPLERDDIDYNNTGVFAGMDAENGPYLILAPSRPKAGRSRESAFLFYDLSNSVRLCQVDVEELIAFLRFGATDWTSRKDHPDLFEHEPYSTYSGVYREKTWKIARREYFLEFRFQRSVRITSASLMLGSESYARSLKLTESDVKDFRARLERGLEHARQMNPPD